MDHEEVDDSAVVDWLGAGDVAVRYQTERDLMGRHDPALQARIAEEGAGAVLLGARGRDGHWGRGFYQPKWTSSHYTLLELKNMALSPADPAAGETVAMILRDEKGPDGGLDPSRTVKRSDACINGMALGYASYFRAPDTALVGIVDFLLGQRLPDGGFNCRFNRSGARHSSVHTTVCVIEGITAYQRSGARYRLDELLAARATSVEFLLRHHLYRSEGTGSPIDPEFTRLHHPPRWHFDILRGLDALADAGVERNERMDDALAVLLSRRRPDGRWAANKSYPGATFVRPAPPGTPNRWITLIAMRILKAYPPPAR